MEEVERKNKMSSLTNRVFLRETTDFGEESIFWRDITPILKSDNFKPKHNVEYIIEYNDLDHLPSYEWNKCVDEYRYYPHNYSLISLSKEDFEKDIQPYIKEPYANNKEKPKMDAKNYSVVEPLLKDKTKVTEGWIRDLIATVAKEEVLKAIAQHENTKIEVTDYTFNIGDHVMKYSGEYHAEGIVIGCFKMTSGEKRYAVEHKSFPSGKFIHLYSDKNIKLFDEWKKEQKEK